MRYMCGSLLLGGMFALAGGCNDPPPATDSRPPQEETPPGADIAPENLPFSTEDDNSPARPVAPGQARAPDEGTGLRPSRFQEMEESSSADFPQFDETLEGESPNLLDSPPDETSRTDLLDPPDDLTFPADATR